MTVFHTPKQPPLAEVAPCLDRGEHFQPAAFLRIAACHPIRGILSANDCEFDRWLQHLDSTTRAGGVADGLPEEDLLHGRG